MSYEPLTLAQAQELGAMTVAEVSSVYSGKDGKCCCGCSGKHSYSKAHQAAAGERRGYAVGDDEVNDRMVAKVLRLLQAAKPEDVMAGKNHYATVVGQRLYVVYPVNKVTA
jgi:hypothetical protein